MISKKAQVYAKALFELDKSLLSALKSSSRLFCEEKTSGQFFASPIISPVEKKELLEAVASSVPKLLKHFLFVLIENKSFFLLPQIVMAYKALEEAESGHLPGELLSAAPVSEGHKKQIQVFLKRFFKKKIELSWKEDKTLIAGAVIKVGPYLLDGSANRALKAFEREGGFKP